MLGTFVAVMDISVVNVALPHMMGTFGQNLSSITWVATCYSIAEIILVGMTSWWSALLGRKRLYLVSFAIFTVGSVLAGTASTFPEMLVFRVIQGIGGGSLIPVSQAILRESFPDEEQGLAMAIYGMGVVLAPAIGPVLGGWLTDHYGWPWIFFINVPVAALGMLLVSAYVQDPPYLKRGIGRTDWTGIALLAVSLTGMQVVLERGEQEDWFQSRWIVVGTIVTVVAAIALVVRELRAKEPVLDFRLLRNFPLTIGSGLMFVFGIVLFGTTFLLPQFAEDMLGYTALDAGLLLLPRAITLFSLMLVAGHLYRIVSPRVLVGAGLVVLYLSMHMLSDLSLEVGFWNLVPALLVMGAGMPFMFVTMSTVALSTVKKADMTAASSIFTLARRVGGNVGYALVATLILHGAQTHRVHLVGHVRETNVNYRIHQERTVAALRDRGVPSAEARHAAVALVDRSVDQQARMLAYNDTMRNLGWLLLVSIPLVLLLPRRRKRGEGKRPPPE
jgi:DHA2 family multidrug resistance protein